MEISVSDNQVIENEILEEEIIDELYPDENVNEDEFIDSPQEDDLEDLETDGFEEVTGSEYVEDFQTFNLENTSGLSDESLEILTSINNNILELKESVVSLNTPIMHKWFYSYNTEQGLLLCIFILLVVIVLQNFLGKRR